MYYVLNCLILSKLTHRMLSLKQTNSKSVIWRAHRSSVGNGSRVRVNATVIIRGPIWSRATRLPAQLILSSIFQSYRPGARDPLVPGRQLLPPRPTPSPHRPTNT